MKELFSIVVYKLADRGPYLPNGSELLRITQDNYHTANEQFKELSAKYDGPDYIVQAYTEVQVTVKVDGLVLSSLPGYVENLGYND